ncbi:MAG: molybdopterin biosynthesis protein MoeB [Candidatus Sericytochromatia bacterium]|nr:MAG: molybdopterin biosynthesis protein MoeB [Candidatus Sericytochromatia bacterium]
MKNFEKLFYSIKSKVKEISVEEVKTLIENENNFLLIDIRESEELENGFLEKSINISRSFLDLKIEDIAKDYSKKIILYCSAGTRSILGAKLLKDLGYSNVYSMKGGFNEWKEKNYPFLKHTDKELSKEQKKRYSKHILLNEIGEEGQKKLLKSKVLLVGAGGLGSPIAYYLTSCGVGSIGIIDNDIVDITNLHRQILHTTSNIGIPKVISAKEKLITLNTDVNIITYNEKLSSDNAENIINNYDLVIDGTDNFDCKYLINDICYKLNKPYIYGSIFKFEGQVSVFNPNEIDKPCYRCLFPKRPPKDLIPNCQQVGVIGVLPGIIGTLQTMEALKTILNKGDILCGKLLSYDALNNFFSIFKIKKNENCFCKNLARNNFDKTKF